MVQQPIEVGRLELSCQLLSFPCMLNALFRICRPKFLIYFREKEVVELLCEISMQRESRKEDRLRQLWFRDLKDGDLREESTRMG